MKVLLTGATGLIGSRIGIELVKAGHEVAATVRDKKKGARLLPFPATLIECDLLNDLSRVEFPEVDAVIHLAGDPVAGSRWSTAKKESILNSRSLGTENLVSKVLSQKKACGVFVSASAIGFYGERGDEKLTETSKKGSGFLSDVCEAWEKPLKKLNQNKVRNVSFRIGMVLASEGGALETILPLFRKRVAGNLGSGRQFMSWIHIDDLVSLLILPLNKLKMSGVYNAVSPNPVQNSEFTKTLAKEMGVQVFIGAPKAALKLVLGEMSQVILASQRVLPERLMNENFLFKYETLQRAVTQIVDTLRDPISGKVTSLFTMRQYVPKKVEEIFSFFSEAENLEKITPEFVNFKILKKSSLEIEKGTLIEYSLKIHGVPVRWRTKIAEWKKNDSFVDVQLKGPYHSWHHTHSFESLGEGTLITDSVRYQLPLGWLGEVAGSDFVKSDVSKIFGYRSKIVFEEFSRDHI